MNFTLSKFVPRVERRDPETAIGWTVRVTIEEGDTQIFDDITIMGTEAVPLNGTVSRSTVEPMLRARLFFEEDCEIQGRKYKAGEARSSHLRKLIQMFDERRRFADVINYPLAED